MQTSFDYTKEKQSIWKICKKKSFCAAFHKYDYHYFWCVNKWRVNWKKNMKNKAKEMYRSGKTEKPTSSQIDGNEIL